MPEYDTNVFPMGESPKLPTSHSKNFFCQSGYKYATSAYHWLCKPFCKKSYVLTTYTVRALTGPIVLIYFVKQLKRKSLYKNKAQLMCYNPVCTKRAIPRMFFLMAKICQISIFKIIIFLPFAPRQPQDRTISQRF
jgi:hypothetical protein